MAGKQPFLRVLIRHGCVLPSRLFTDSRPRLTISDCSCFSPLRFPAEPFFKFSVTNFNGRFPWNRHFTGSSGEDDHDPENDDVEEDESDVASGMEEEENTSCTPEEKESEAAAIGYRVIGPLDTGESPFKPYEPVFAVVQIGSHQFKVCNGDSIFTERLKFCGVNDKLLLTKVLLLGSQSQTMLGRPVLPDAEVHAVVEEHALDAKVIIFKKKRRKNYRRTRGHRQELTKLRITSIEGFMKPIAAESEKIDDEDGVEQVAVSAS